MYMQPHQNRSVRPKTSSRNSPLDLAVLSLKILVSYMQCTQVLSFFVLHNDKQNCVVPDSLLCFTLSLIILLFWQLFKNTSRTLKLWLQTEMNQKKSLITQVTILFLQPPLVIMKGILYQLECTDQSCTQKSAASLYTLK